MTQPENVIHVAVGIDPRMNALARPGPHALEELGRVKEAAGIHEDQAFAGLHHQGIGECRHKAKPGLHFLESDPHAIRMDVELAEIALPGSLRQFCQLPHSALPLPRFG